MAALRASARHELRIQGLASFHPRAPLGRSGPRGFCHAPEHRAGKRVCRLVHRTSATRCHCLVRQAGHVGMARRQRSARRGAIACSRLRGDQPQWAVRQRGDSATGISSLISATCSRSVRSGSATRRVARPPSTVSRSHRCSCASPVMSGRSSGLSGPGAASHTAGIALTIRLAALALPPPAAPGSPTSVPCTVTVRLG